MNIPFPSWFEGNRVWKLVDDHHARPGTIIKLHHSIQKFDVQFDDGSVEERADPREFTKKAPPVPSP